VTCLQKIGVKGEEIIRLRKTNFLRLKLQNGRIGKASASVCTLCVWYRLLNNGAVLVAFVTKRDGVFIEHWCSEQVLKDFWARRGVRCDLSLPNVQDAMFSIPMEYQKIVRG